MQIIQPTIHNNASCVNFAAHNKKIKVADDVCRMVMREFPVYSNTKFENYYRKRNETLYQLYGYSGSLIGEIRGYSSQASNPLEYYLRKLSAIKKFKAGNCSELADVTAISLRLNGVKNADAYSLHAYNQKTGKVRELDHTVVGVNLTRPIPQPTNSTKEFYGLDNGGIIVDPWAGFADSERSASATFKSDKRFHLKLEPDEIVVYSLSKNVELGNILNKKDVLYLKHQYPELIKSKKFSLWDKILWKFMDKSKYNFEEISIGLKEAIKRNYKLKSALSENALIELLNKKIGKNCEKL